MTAVFLAAPGPVYIDPNQEFVQSNATITTSGSIVYVGYGVRDLYLVVNIVNAPTGTTPTITYSLQEVDPGNRSTAVSTSVTGAAITAIGTQILNLPLTVTGAVQVSWTVTGTTPSFTGVYATLVSKITTSSVGLDSAGLQVPLRMKDASISATGTDPALVVAVSPNNTIATNVADITATGTLGALNANVQITLAGHTTSGFQLSAGTLIGTIVAEISIDGGTTWTTTYFDETSGNKVSSVVFSSANTALTSTIVGVGGTGLARIRVSAYTSGTANITLRTSVVNDPSVLYTGQVNAIFEPPTAAQIAGWDGTTLRVPAVKAASVVATSTDQALVVAFSPNSNSVTETDQLSNSSYPDPSASIVGTDSPTIDAFGNLEVRGPIFTDEGALRDDFSGSALTTILTGTLGFTASGINVTGSGTSFENQINMGQYIKKSSDSETLYAQVADIISNTQLSLVNPYAGTTAAGVTGVVSNWQTVTPAGGSIGVATSIMTMTLGTTASAAGSLRSLGDYLPYTANFYVAISQRIANQTIYFGFEDVVGAPNQQATVQFTGTTNTQVNFVTSYDNASSIQTTTVTLPNAGTTAAYHTYAINLGATQATLTIDGIVVAQNTLHMPSPYTTLYVVAGFANGSTAPASSTTMMIDYIFYEDIDRVQVFNNFLGEPQPVQSIVKPFYGTNGQALTITLTSLANAAARASTVVNNTITLYEDALLFVKLVTGTSGVATTGYVNMYGYGSVDGGTNYPEGITGTDGGVTLTSPPNLILLAQMNANTNSVSKTFGPFSFCRQYGLDRLPSLWGVVVVNETGASFGATGTGFLVEYQGINGQLV